MRHSPLFAITVFTLQGLTNPVFAADVPEQELVLHVAEGSPAGQIVVDLSERLGFGEQSTVRLVPDQDAAFEINAKRQLVVSETTELDYESGLSHALMLEVKSPATADVLQERFVDFLGESATASRFKDHVHWIDRTVLVEVIVDDQPEPPRILQGVFPRLSATAATPGADLGRVIASDPDRDDQLRFKLLDAESIVTIDPQTGQLSIRNDARLPNAARIRATVEVVDSQGLAATQEITIPVQANAVWPETSSASQTEIATNAPEDTNASVPNPIPDVTTSNIVEVATSSLGEATVTNMPEDPDSPASPPSVPEIALNESPASQIAEATEQPPRALTPPVLAKTDQAPTEVSRTDNALAWSLVCGVCVIVFGVICWGPVQRLIQKFVLQPQENDVAPSQGNLVNPQTNLVSTTAQNPAMTATSESDEAHRFRGKTDTHELHTLLASLDETYRSRLGQDPKTESSVGDDENFAIYDDSPGTSTSATAIANAARLVRDAIPRPELSEPVSRASHKTLSGDKSERDQMEEFRKIARTYNRADIHRSRREQMRIEWMTRGAAVASSIITGVICLFTKCFGAISVPCGTVLLAVAAALLMKRSLYVDDHPSDSTGPAGTVASATSQSTAKPSAS